METLHALSSQNNNQVVSRMLAQRELAKAEVLLLSGFSGMEEQKESISPIGKDNLPKAAKALAKLYEKTRDNDKADKWRELQKQLELNTEPDGESQE